MNDEQLTQFLDQGYLVLTPDRVPDSVHDDLYAQAIEAYASRHAAEDRRVGIDFIGDHIVSQMPALESILGAPNVHGALTTIVGEDYVRYGHSFIHESSSYDQGFHKDSHLPWSLRGALRSHRPNWAMMFYYPQDTTAIMGATRIVPGSQYWNVDHEIDGHTVGEDRIDFEEKALYADLSPSERDQRLAGALTDFDPHLESIPVEVKKGSVVIVHFDLIHRGARNDTDQQRFMFKFWFARMTEPRNRRPAPPPAQADARRKPVIESIGAWISGRPNSSASNDVTFDPPANEGERIARGYILGARQDPALPGELSSENESERRAAMYGLTAFGVGAIPVAIDALTSKHMGVRKSAAFVLGELAIYRPHIIEALATVLDSDSHDEVRSTALVSLARIARRTIANGDTSLISRVIEILRPYTDTGREPDYADALIPMNPIRQYAALALLTIATEAIKAGADRSTLTSLFDLASRLVQNETDRYAQWSANETVSRLTRN